LNDHIFSGKVDRKGDKTSVLIEGKIYLVEFKGPKAIINGKPHDIIVKRIWRIPELFEERGEYLARPISKPLTARGKGIIKPPMPGRIVSVFVKPGDLVKLGTPLLTLEAMKMQNEIASPLDGTVKSVLISPGDSVASDQVLVVVE